jgi:putative membrane protein
MNGFEDMMNMMDGMTGGWGSFGLAGTLFSFLLLIGLLAAVAWVVAKLLLTGTGRPDSAEEIVRGRFARGEIDAEEYERSLMTLRGEPGRRAYEDYVHEATRQLEEKPSARR